MKPWTHFSVVAETSRLWRITFDNPPINLVSPETLTELPRLVDQLAAASELRVVMFESANPDYFLNHYDTSRVAETPKELGASGYPLLIDASTRLSRRDNQSCRYDPCSRLSEPMSPRRTRPRASRTVG